jgi:hypothetical protein
MASTYLSRTASTLEIEKLGLWSSWVKRSDGDY